MRVGVIHAAGNAVAVGLYAASLARRGPRAGRWLRLAGPSFETREVGGAIQVCLPGAG